MPPEGVRWQELIDVVADLEILLIGLLPGEKFYEKDSDEDENEMPRVNGLEKDFHKEYKSMDITKIMNCEDDDVFAKMKEFLLIQDLRLKETCQHLTDVLKLINRHGEAEENFGLKDMLSPTTKIPPSLKKANILS